MFTDKNFGNCRFTVIKICFIPGYCGQLLSLLNFKKSFKIFSELILNKLLFLSGWLKSTISPDLMYLEDRSLWNRPARQHVHFPKEPRGSRGDALIWLVIHSNDVYRFLLGPGNLTDIKGKLRWIGLSTWSQFSFSSVQSLSRPHELQHARPPCPSPTPGVYPNSCPLSRWCHPTISSSVIPFPAFNLSQHQGLFQWSSYLYQLDKVLEL